MIREAIRPAYDAVAWRRWRLRRWYELAGTLEAVVFHTLYANRLSQLTFVEVGVFKGDNAVSVIRMALDGNVTVRYVGFDLFENKDVFFGQHPDDLAMYDTPGDSYFEFASGGHSYSAVRRKLQTVLSDDRFTLIAGDSTQTIPASRSEIDGATIVYIDGCHDYDVVVQDWNNVEHLFVQNPPPIAVFDDTTYTGVDRLMREIRRDHRYRVYRLNANQSVVVSSRTKLTERLWCLATGAIMKWREWRAARRESAGRVRQAGDSPAASG